MCGRLHNKSDNEKDASNIYRTLRDAIKGITMKRPKRGFPRIKAKEEELVFGAKKTRFKDFRTSWLEILVLIVMNIIPGWNITDPVDSLPLNPSTSLNKRHIYYDNILWCIATLINLYFFKGIRCLHQPNGNNENNRSSSIHLNEPPKCSVAKELEKFFSEIPSCGMYSSN
jgi:hypothetical protein